MLAPHFVMFVKEQLVKNYSQEMIETGGLKIITTLDFEKQKIAEDVVKKGAEENLKKYKAANAALVAIDPKTGQILAMAGSKDYFGKKPSYKGKAKGSYAGKPNAGRRTTNK